MDTELQELAELVGHGVLRNHAESVLADAYAGAVERASAETGLTAASFPRMNSPAGPGKIRFCSAPSIRTVL